MEYLPNYINKKEIDIEQAEANYFAMCLLMPKRIILKRYEEVIRQKISIFDTLKQVSEEFGVSEIILMDRLRILGVVFNGVPV